MPASGFAPNWADENDWRGINNTLDHTFATLGPKLDRVRQLARQTRENLEPLFPILDRLTALVCPGCLNVCCIESRPTFSFRDLVLLHALGLTPPPHQTRRNDHEPCRYLGPAGCRLDRLVRPHICTWWLCRPLRELLRQEPEPVRRRLADSMILINRDLDTLDRVYRYELSAC